MTIRGPDSCSIGKTAGVVFRLPSQSGAFRDFAPTPRKHQSIDAHIQRLRDLVPIGPSPAIATRNLARGFR